MSKESVGIQGPASEVVQNALLALAVRCETEEPSRELDLRIAKVLTGGHIPHCPAYTTSLDAAVTPALSPHGAYEAVQDAMRVIARKHALHMEFYRGASFSTELARYTCAAALRARAEIGR